MKNFALIGAAGYIAPRHMEAIKVTQNNLVATLDKHDSVGILDKYFSDADFFTEFERFDRHLEKLKRQNDSKKVDYVSICSPNYLHDSHIRFALRIGAHAICEKPLVLNPWNIDGLYYLEQETGKTIFPILQLRLHPTITNLKKIISIGASTKKYNVDLSYITSRGSWYHHSWKGDIIKSGGIGTNIGIHFFDMLLYLFGDLKESTVHISTPTRCAGLLELEKADVRWFLSIDKTDLPAQALQEKQTTFRSIKINGEELEFSDGFTELHTDSYKKILKGDGFTLKEARPSIELAYIVRNSPQIGLKGDYHPFLKEKKSA